MTAEKHISARTATVELYRKIMAEPYTAVDGRRITNAEAIARAHVSILVPQNGVDPTPPPGWCELLNELYCRAGLDDA